MQQFFPVLCLTSLLVFGNSPMPVMVAQADETCIETTDTERASGYLSYYSANVSSYNGSLCVNISTSATEKMEEIGIKNLTIQYSYDNVNWYNEWNAGDFLAYDTNRHALNNYIMALDRSECYYRICCKHYAKKSFLNTQIVSNTSNAVWIG